MNNAFITDEQRIVLLANGRESLDCVFHAKANAVSRANRTHFPRQSER